MIETNKLKNYKNESTVIETELRLVYELSDLLPSDLIEEDEFELLEKMLNDKRLIKGLGYEDFICEDSIHKFEVKTVLEELKYYSFKYDLYIDLKMAVLETLKDTIEELEAV